MFGSKATLRARLLFFNWSLVFLVGGACSSESDDCSAGDEGCACYPNSTCNAGLSCFSKLCVNPEDTDAMNPTSGQPQDGGTVGSDETSGDHSSHEGSNEATSSESSNATTNTGTEKGDGGDTSPGEIPNNPPDASSPVGKHGQLQVNGTHIVDEHGKIVQLKGVSSMWLNWDPTGYAESLEGLRYMRDEWGLSLIRAAMGVDAEGAYLEDPSHALSQVETIIHNALRLGVYVLVDWHDHAAEEHQSEAQEFFEQLAKDYGHLPNVLYEVYNEPLDVSWSSVLKPYHEALRDTIRAHDPDNIIILGTPNWSQDVDVAAANPVEGNNLMYTVHFYSCTHGAQLRNRANQALQAGLPLFVTEWGATHADGGIDGIVCDSEAGAWHDWMDDNYISWAAWKFDGCTDSSCFFVDRDVPVDGNWSESQLNGHAPFVIERMQRANPPPDAPGPDPDPQCTPSGACADGDGLDCGEEGLVERDCAACELLSCGIDCCHSVGHFGAVSQPDFAVNMSLVSHYEASSNEATLEMDFSFGPTDDQQVGVIGFKLNGTYEVDPVVLEIAATSTNPIEVSLEIDDGEAGCLYDTLEDDGIFFPFSSVICWGGFDQYSLVEQINVRLVGHDSSSESMTVHAVSF